MNWTLSLNNEEKNTLQKYMKFYRSLDEGLRKPTTDAQKHFIAVCKGKATPETDHERLYLKFRNKKKDFLEIHKQNASSFSSIKSNVKDRNRETISWYSGTHVSPNKERFINTACQFKRKKTRTRKDTHSNKARVIIGPNNAKLERIHLGRLNQRLKRVFDALVVGSD